MSNSNSNSMNKFLNNFKIFAGIRKNELSDYIKFFVNESNILEKKFIVFAHYRTGSTLLANLLNCHPDIFCDGEIFLKFINVHFKKVFFPCIYAESQSLKSNKKNYGCDVKLDQLVKISIK
ncbi:hypothetical protein GM3708_1873 [Geminocystis sp. NIES-3708]|uniref:hypothetical protein n=1 Tax=Geminocystis sp. NIES-3708 TaxID=1615909 RepID=UPI0005FC7C90|nr:hypothetical protein [Geminocystis sp. NIES-3708]BAQ61467.1 hypothetical protein GM3708_1873 [Geminocystis sp. NIES-3708]